MILFCEYAVPEPNREAFRSWAAARPELWQGGELMENVTQPGVFVEIWPVTDESAALRKQKERLDGRSDWKQMETWVKGGAEGVRVWTFRPIIPRG